MTRPLPDANEIIFRLANYFGKETRADAIDFIRQQAARIEEQRLTIVALNSCIGGESSTSTENLVRVSREESRIAAVPEDIALARWRAVHGGAGLETDPPIAAVSEPSHDNSGIVTVTPTSEWNEAIEEAAKECESRMGHPETGANRILNSAAYAIRGLKR